MEIILLENIINLRNIGDKVSVKNGFGRNYLLKKGKALRFNKENQELVNNKTFTFNRECKESGDLYGSIKPKEVTNLIKEKSNAEVSPSQIILKNDLNKIGLFKAEINFHSDVRAQISIKVDKIEAK